MKVIAVKHKIVLTALKCVKCVKANSICTHYQHERELIEIGTKLVKHVLHLPMHLNLT